EEVVEELALYEFFTDFGEAFQYSNQMVATGGYAAGAAAGGEWGDLMAAYAAALQERVLDPIGMSNTTLSFEEVVGRDNYAIPHALMTGVVPDGASVVSEENLSETWLPQVAVTADASYGLGWFVDE